MSYYAVLDNKKKSGGDVATNHGWPTFRRWIESLDNEMPQLRHLTAYGWSQELPALADDLAAARAERPDADNAEVARGLLAMLQDRDDAEVIVITDGVQESDHEQDV